MRAGTHPSGGIPIPSHDHGLVAAFVDEFLDTTMEFHHTSSADLDYPLYRND
jgi:hypothetical protein